MKVGRADGAAFLRTTIDDRLGQLAPVKGRFLKSHEQDFITLVALRISKDRPEEDSQFTCPTLGQGVPILHIAQ